MTRRKRRTNPGDLEFVPLSRDEQIAHGLALVQYGDQNPEELADYYSEAAGYYALAGEDTTAEELFRAALADGGEVLGGVHGYYADFLFDRGRDVEALALIEAARKARPEDPEVHISISEALDAHGHHRQAAAWATRGLVLLYGSLADITADDLLADYEGRLLAADRLRARRGAGLPADHIDDMVAPVVARAAVAIVATDAVSAVDADATAPADAGTTEHHDP